MRPGLDSSEALALVHAIRQGDVAAWHRFIDEYAGLIFSVTRRYLAYGSLDERRDLFVEILGKLREGALCAYDGRARLSTWLFIFARSRCLDFLRKDGRRGPRPMRWRKLPEPDRTVFKLYFIEGVGRSEMRALLERSGFALTSEELAASLDRLEETLDEGTRRRLAYDLVAESIGMVSGRLLEFLHGLKIENELIGEDTTPEGLLLQRDLAHALEQVREYVSRLPELERKVIALRFYEGRTARQAWVELKLRDQRQVYTVETRAIRRLRSMFRE